MMTLLDVELADTYASALNIGARSLRNRTASACVGGMAGVVTFSLISIFAGSGPVKAGACRRAVCTSGCVPSIVTEARGGAVGDVESEDFIWGGLTPRATLNPPPGPKPP